MIVLNIIIICLLVITIFLLSLIYLKSKKNQVEELDSSKLINGINVSLNKDIYKIGFDLNKSISDMRTEVTKTLGDSKTESNEAMLKTQGEIQDKFRVFQTDFEKRISEAFISINESIEKKLLAINNVVDERLNNGFEKTNESFNKIAATVSRIEEAKTTMIQLTSEVNELQNILNNNQARGAFGEYQLNQILENIFGDFKKRMFDLQYEMDNGGEKVKADAVVFMKPQELVLCIDSKFPFTSYATYVETHYDSANEETKALNLIKADVKKHIDAISIKYVIPGKTLDYALMFVPSDGLLCLLHSKIPQIIEYATEKRVVIVSPTIIIPTLLSCKTMIIDSLKAEKIQELNKVLEHLGAEFKAFGEAWVKLNKNLNAITKQSHTFDVKVKKLTKKFNSIKSSEIESHDEEELIIDEIIEEEEE